MSDKTYIKGIYIKSLATKYGEILKVSVKVDVLIEQLRELQNQSGYVNFDILKMKEPNDKGNTHYCILNEYKKDTHDTSNTNNNNTEVNGNNENNDDLPF